jgi:DNA-binding NarL/FixJ family response regulator
VEDGVGDGCVDACGAELTEGFPDRSRRELLATGGRARKRSAETRRDLTPKRRGFARLARDGVSNAETGARLFVIKSTVAYHLRNVFSKLDIRSRHQLTEVIGEGANAQRAPEQDSPPAHDDV